MKNAKKIVSLVLALAMVLSMSVVAFAVDTNGKITIENTVKDQRYEAYHLLNLEEYDSTTGSYLYTVDDNWAGFFAEGATGRNFVDVDSTTGYVTVKDGVSGPALVEALLAYLKDHPEIKATRGRADQNEGVAKADNETIVYENVILGYYLIKSSLGSICSLTTTKPEATVEEKNVKPTLTKDVKENSNDTWMKKNDANVGDTVEFRTTITVQGTAKGYVVHDTMEQGLLYKQVSKVTVKKAGTDTESDVLATNYTVTKDVDHEAKGDKPAATHTFDVVFDDNFCKTLGNGDKVTVYYEATLTSDAITANGVDNEAYLTYKDSSNTDQDTAKDKTTTYTWTLPVFKYTQNSDGTTTKTPLNGAEFSLYTDAACKNAVKFNSTNAGSNQYTCNSTGGSITVFKTEGEGDNAGKFQLEGLDSGTYYLQENKAPKGYNKLDKAIKVEIDTNGNVKMDVNGNDAIEAEEIVAQVEVKNNKGAQMPTTGGMGTTIFYILGSIMLLGAGVLLVTKKRMSAAK